MRDEPLATYVSRGRIADFEPGSGVTAGAFRPDFDDSSWLSVAMPTHDEIDPALFEARIVFGPRRSLHAHESTDNRLPVGGLTRS